MFSMSKFLIIYYKDNGFGQHYKCQDDLIFIELRIISVNSCIFREDVVIFEHIPRNSGIFRDIPGFHNAPVWIVFQEKYEVFPTSSAGHTARNEYARSQVKI